jgi:hypothetical protein
MEALTVCVSASSTDGALAPLIDLQAMLGATSSEEAFSPFEVGQQQQGALRRASRAAETYVGYPLLAQVYSERVAGDGRDTLMLSRTPLRAILRVFDSTTTESATEYGSTGIVIEDAEAGLIKRTDGSVFAWSPRIDPTTLGLQPMPGSEIRNWLVEYQAGYVFPETSSTEYGTTSTGQTLPDDIVDAVLSRSREIVQGDANVLSKKVGDLQLTYGARGLARDGTNVRSEFEETLSKYRRVV